SIASVLRRGMRMVRAKVPELPLRAVTAEAVCHARKRLGVAPLRVVFRKLAGRITPTPSFHGLRVWGVDGVKLTVPDTPSNEAAFGRPKGSRGKSAYPQMSAVALIDTQTHGVKDVAFGRGNDAERPRARELIKNLGPGDLVLKDCGFAAAWMFERTEGEDAHFLCRIPDGWNPRIKRILGPGDYLVEISARVHLSPREQEEQGRKTRPVTLTLRMIQYRIGGGEVVRLLTSLTDPDRYPARDLAELYHVRWECEMTYDELETHLMAVGHGSPKTFFRSKTPDGVLQEAYGAFIMYNLTRDLMKEAAEARDMLPLHISFVESVEVIRMALPDFSKASPEERPALARQLLDDIADCRLDRPRRPRTYPRKVKRKMSNFGLKRIEHRQIRCDFKKMLVLTDDGIHQPPATETRGPSATTSATMLKPTGRATSGLRSLIDRIRAAVSGLVEQAHAA
ncbi:MAG TPA: IS4 family transposase, partial [Candidatus Paceibacterota bacterium]|nr:IS4 family transposase [Candidatus Paceibacterota bacterium]